MSTIFRCKVNYLGNELEVESDSFADLHTAIAGISELNRDFRFLVGKGADAKHIVASHRIIDGNDYYGVIDAKTGRNTSYGSKREKGQLVPFFPKGADGYYDPSDPANESKKPTKR